MQKNSFVLYTQYNEQIELLTDAQAGQLLRAVMYYAQTGEKPVLEDILVRMAFSIIRQQMEYDAKKYEETCQKRSLAGKKGGRPRKQPIEAAWKEEAGEERAEEKAKGFLEKQAKAKKADNDNEYENENENENEYENENEKEKRSFCGGGEEETRACAKNEQEALLYFCEAPTTENELAKFKALTKELVTRYSQTKPSRYDAEKTFGYVYRRIEREDGTAIAAYDEQKAALLCYTFEKAAESGKANWSYVRGIYRRWSERRIGSVEEAERYDWEQAC